MVLVRPSERPGCDIDYLFVQVGVERPIVDYASNCGNLTAAAAVYALEEGLLAGDARPGLVRMFNRNVGQRIDAVVPAPPTRGDWREEARLAGMPITGLAVLTEYLDPAGTVTGALLPTGRPRDVIMPSVGEPIEVSIVDLGAPIVFVRAADLGLRGDETPATLNAAPGLLPRLESIRAAGAARVGLAADEAEAAVSSPVLPRLAIVSPPTVSPPPQAADLMIRATSLGRAHHACPITTALCTAAAARTAGTLPFAFARVVDPGTVRISHPRGALTVTVRTSDGEASANGGGSGGSGGSGKIVSVGVLRTARRLLAGTAYLPG